MTPDITKLPIDQLYVLYDKYNHAIAEGLLTPADRVRTSRLLHEVEVELLDRKPRHANPFKDFSLAQLQDEIARCNINIAGCIDAEAWNARKATVQDELQRRPRA